MTSLLHVADLHLGYRQYGIKQREEDGFLTFESVLTEGQEEGVDAILIPGDLFDDRDVRPRTLQRVESALESVDVPVIVTPGNHDQNLNPRDTTWLRYLNDRGLITLLSADLSGDVAQFVPADDEETAFSTGGYVDLSGPDGPIRVFGLQYRGGYIETALRQIAAGIEETNEQEGEPAQTLLMAHFGVEEIVPDLGANVSFADLEPVADLVDYLALGHIHKQYEAEGWIFNPGSPEAFDVQEGSWDGKHGYYVVTVTEEGIEPEYRLSKRRPYFRTEFSVTGYETFDTLEKALREHAHEERSRLDEERSRDIYTARGQKRRPIVDLRLNGTLNVDRHAFDIDRIREVVAEELDPLHVQPADHTEDKDIQELLGEMGEAIDEDGRIDREAMERTVFGTIAEESPYSEEAETVASLLSEVEDMVNERNEPVSEVAELLGERRRALFPDDDIGDGESDESVEEEEVDGVSTPSPGGEMR